MSNDVFGPALDIWEKYSPILKWLVIILCIVAMTIAFMLGVLAHMWLID